ncbi:MAG: AAA family ATPase [Brachybacterium sp.]|nr:AAA family ATPase [Brachybacterium sp.]
MEPSAAQLAQEQDYVDGLYVRLDELLEHVAENLRATQHSQSASTHQNRSERDAFAAMYEDRLALLRTVSQNVVFGRLDTDGEDRHYIGRIGLFTPEREQLLVDWRAPAAAAFYQATSVDRMGVRLRRHLITRGREVIALEDDVLDSAVLEQSDVEHATLQGEGALLAAVSGRRTGRMGDIVSTIQSEQDRIIRSTNRGVLVVQGGPGTGKTAVALHRAAYLLYTHRRRLEHSGVLIVAPTRGFLRYIERVLPSLGESGVVMLTPGELYPGVSTTLHDDDPVARVKCHPMMAKLLARAVKQRQIVPTGVTRIRVDGVPIDLTPDDLAAARREARATHRPHNSARSVFVRAALERLVIRYEDALRAQGHTVVPEDRAGHLQDLRSHPDIRRALNLAWMPYTPETFLRILLSRPERLRAAAPAALREDVAAVIRSKDSPWTVEDVPLLDEVAELLGDDEELHRRDAEQARSRHDGEVAYAREVLENVDTSGIVRAEDLAAQVERVHDARTLAERATTERTWTYGHVVADEAQELSPMMWRALMRRCPTKSFTVVGDIAQTSSAAGAASWEGALEPYVQDRLQVEQLTVNYRTPARIMDAAVRAAEAAELPVTPVTSVREGEHPVEIHAVAPEVIDAAVVAQVRRCTAEGLGRLAVICAIGRVEPLAHAIRGAGMADVGTGSAGIDDPVAVMTAQESKGLEFDAVVVVEPTELVEAHAQGAGDLYVAMTRPTQRLHVVHAAPLPPGFTDPGDTGVGSQQPPRE